MRTYARGRGLTTVAARTCSNIYMAHQSVSEDMWFKTVRLARLSEKNEEWWEGETSFFNVRRTRLWIMLPDIAARSAQHLRADGGDRRADDPARSDHLRLSERKRLTGRGGGAGAAENSAAGARIACFDRASGKLTTPLRSWLGKPWLIGRELPRRAR